MADVELDDFDLDDDLELDLDFGFEDPPPKVTQGREAVVETASIAGREAASKVLGKGKERQLILSSLPKEYGNALESYDKLAGTGGDLVEQARSEFNESARALKRASKQAAPLLKKYLPAKIGEKLDKLLESGDEDSGSWDSEKEDPNELAISQSMSELAQIQTEQVKRQEDGEMRDELKDQIDSVRGDNANKLIGIIADNVSKDFQYTNSVTNAYQRKMMELNFRQFFAQRDLLAASRDHFERMQLDIAAVVKNTALPDYAKEQFGEVTKALMQRETIQKILPGQFTANYVSDMGANISTKIREFGEGFRSTASELGDGLEQLGALDDTEGFSEEELAAKQRQDAARLAGGQLANKFVVPLRDKLLKNVREKGEANEHVRDFGRNAAYQLGTVPEMLNSIAMGEDTGTFLDNFRTAIEAVAPQLDQGGFQTDTDNREALAEASKFDVRSYKTLNEVIPGLLTRIDNSINAGNGNDTPTDVFDYRTSTWVKADEIAAEVRKAVGGEEDKKARVDYINKMVDVIDPDKTLDSEERDELTRHIEERARTARRFDMKRILAGETDLSLETVEKLDEIHGDKSSIIDINNRLRTGIASVRASFKDGDEAMEEVISRYGAENLERAGVLKRNGSGYEAAEGLEDTFSTYEEAIADSPVDANGDIVPAPRREATKEESTVADTVLGIGALSSASRTEEPFERFNFEDVVTTLATGASAVRVVNHVTNGGVPMPDTPANAPSDDSPNRGGKVSGFAGKSPYSASDATVGETGGSGKVAQDALFTQLGDLYEQYHSTEARQRAMQPIIDAVTAALTETSAKPEATAILEVLQELSINGVGSSSDDPTVSELKSRMFAGIKKGFAFGGNIGGKVLGKLRGAGTAFRNKLSQVRESVGSIKEAGANIKQNLGNTIKGVFGEADIYDADGKLFLSGKLLKAGGYFDSEGNPIKSIKDVKGAIYDKAGNVVVDYDEVKTKIGGLSKNVGGKFEKIVGGGLGMATDAVGAVTSRVTNAVKATYDKAVETGRSFNAEDVYLQGEDSPRLRASLMAKGFYVSKSTGKTIYTPEDIDGEVLDAEGNVILSAEDLADPEKRLVNKRGKVFRGRIERLKDGFEATKRLVGKGIGKVKDGVTGGAKAVKDMIAGKVNVKFGSDAEESAEESNTTKWLIKIHDLLDDRLDGGDRQREELKQEAKEAMDSARETFTSAAESIKGAASDLKDTAVERSEQLKEETATKVEEAKERAEDLKRTTAEKAETAKEKAKQIAKDAAEKIKAEKEKLKADKEAKRKAKLDASGDGLRDGGFRSRFNKFKNDDADGKPKPKEKDGKKSSSGIGALLSKLSGLLMPIGLMIKESIGALTSGMGGMITKLLGKVGLFKGATTAASAATTAATAAGTTATAAGAASKTSRVLNVAKSVGGVALRGAGWLLRGLSALNPVGLGVLAASAVAYGAYRLATRTEHLDRLRYGMYGTDNYTHGRGDDVTKIAYLEDSLSKHLSFSNGFSNIRGIGESETATIASGMDIDVTSPEQYREWQIWFKDRFLPVYLLWTTRSYQQFPDKKLSEISETDDYRSQLAVAKGTKLDYSHPAYKMMNTPFEDTIDMDDLIELREDVISYLTDEAEDQKEDSGSKDKLSVKEEATTTPTKPKLSGYVTGDFKKPETTSSYQKHTPDTPANKSKANTKPKGSGVTVMDDVKVSRNPDSVNILESIRFRTYGLRDMHATRIKALMDLEDYVHANMTITKTSVTVHPSTDAVFEQSAAGFGLSDINDHQRAIFKGWYVNRFLPVFCALCLQTERLAKGNDPLRLVISSGNSYLGNIATAMAGARDSNGVSIWQHSTSPWDETTPLSFPNSVMKRVKSLNDFVHKDKVTEEKLANEVKTRKVEVVEQQVRRNETPTANSLADRFIAQGQTSYTGVAEDASSVPVPYASAPGQENSSFTPSVVDFEDIEADGSAYAELKRFGSSKEDIGALLTETSKFTGVDTNTLGTIAMVESSFNPTAKPPVGSAKGLFQFIDSTWNEMMGKHASKYGIPSGTHQFDSAANALLGAEYLKESARSASKASGGEATTAGVYMGHFLGQGGMRKFYRNMQKDPNRIAALDFRAEAKANPPIFVPRGRPATYRQVYELIQRKMRTNTSHASRFMELSSPQTLLASAETPSIDAVPGQREAVTNHAAQRSAQIAVDNKASMVAPGSVSSSEVIAKTNDDLTTEIDTLDDAKSSKEKAVTVAKRNTSTVIASREKASAAVNVKAMETSSEVHNVLIAQLEVQKEQRDQLAGIQQVLGEYIKVRTTETGTPLPSKKDPLEVVHAKGSVSTSRRRLS